MHILKRSRTSLDDVWAPFRQQKKVHSLKAPSQLVWYCTAIHFCLYFQLSVTSAQLPILSENASRATKSATVGTERIANSSHKPVYIHVQTLGPRDVFVSLNKLRIFLFIFCLLPTAVTGCYI